MRVAVVSRLGRSVGFAFSMTMFRRNGTHQIGFAATQLYSEQYLRLVNTPDKDNDSANQYRNDTVYLCRI